MWAPDSAFEQAVAIEGFGLCETIGVGAGCALLRVSGPAVVLALFLLQLYCVPPLFPCPFCRSRWAGLVCVALHNPHALSRVDRSSGPRCRDTPRRVSTCLSFLYQVGVPLGGFPTLCGTALITQLVTAVVPEALSFMVIAKAARPVRRPASREA